MEPEVFGPYRLDALIGRGGMGEVHRAYDQRRRRFVALKRLLRELAADDQYRARFQRESALAAKLNDPHIVPIHDYGEIDGQLFIDMRLVEGGDLADVVRRGPLSAARTVDVIAQVADALDAAHAQSLVHRDVKPSNVLLVGVEQSTRGVAYLTDFGIARALDGPTVSRTSLGMGSAGYMAPERFTGDEWDERVDVYSLACVLVECLLGHRPFQAESLPSVMHAHLMREPPRPTGERPDLPPALDDVVARGMAKDPAARYPTAGELADAARDALEGARGAGVAPRRRGASRLGARDLGPRDSGPRDSSPRDSSPRDSSPRDSSPRDSGPGDSGPGDSGPGDSGPGDSGPGDSGPGDSGPGDPERTAARDDATTGVATSGLVARLPADALTDEQPTEAADLTERTEAARTEAPTRASNPVHGGAARSRPSSAADRTADRAATRAVRRPLSRRRLLVTGGAAVGLVVAGGATWAALGSSGERAAPWTVQTGDKVYSSPLVDGGVVYVGSSDGHLYALAAASGAQRWKYAADGAVTSSPRIADGTVFFGGQNGFLHAVDARTGERRWTTDTGGPVHSSPAVANGVVVVGSRSDTLLACDLRSGAVLWRFVRGDWFNSSPAIADGVVYVGCRDHNVHAVDAATGELRWSYVTSSTVDSSPRVVGSSVFIGGDDGKVRSLDAGTGSWIWDFTAQNGIVSTPTIADGVLYVGSDDGSLYACEADTGRLRWSYPTASGIRSTPLVTNGLVVVGSHDRFLHAVDAASGQVRWRFPAAGPIDDSSPATADGLIYVGTLAGTVHAVDAMTGRDRP